MTRLSSLVSRASIALALTTAPAFAQIYVNASNPAPGDGSTWANAAATLQDGLDQVALLGLAEPTIYVGVGVYKPTVSPTGAARDATFLLPEGTTLVGGFTDDPALGLPRQPRQCILDGDIGSPSISDNCYTVVTLPPYAGKETFIEGFVIRNGNANGSGGIGQSTAPRAYGGGIFCYDAHLELRDVFVQLNRAKEEGGGIYFGSSESGGRSFRAYRSYIQFNLAEGSGGGASISNYTGDHDPAGYEPKEYGPSWVFNCTFERNFAGNPADVNNLDNFGGGGLYLGSLVGGAREFGVGPDGFPDLAYSLMIANTRFYTNSVAGRGAACRFHGNAQNVYLVNNTFAGNKVSKEPYLNPSITHDPASVYIDGTGVAEVVMASTIAYFTTAENGAVDTMNAVDGPGVDPVTGGYPRLFVFQSDVFTTATGAFPAPSAPTIPPGLGNYDVDPQFEDFAGFNLQLKSTSALLDASEEGWLPYDYPDIDGDGVRGPSSTNSNGQVVPRHFETGAGQDRVVDVAGGPSTSDLDVGAFERQQ